MVCFELHCYYAHAVQCDSKLPQCTPCKERGIQCPGYRARFQFVSERSSRKKGKTDDTSIATTDLESIPAADTATALSYVANIHETLDEISLIQPQSLTDTDFLALPQTMENTAVQQALISRYSSHYIPNHSADPIWGPLESNLTELPSWIWLLPTVQQAGSDALLNDIVLALILGNLGLWEDRDTDLRLSSLLHARAVRRLRSRIVNKTESQTDATLAAVMVFGIYELQLPSTNNGEGYWAHLRGVNALLALRGPSIFKSAYGRKLFWGSQFNQFVIAVRKRGCRSVMRSDFKEEEVEGMAKTMATDVRLYPIIQRLPPLMARVDQFQKIEGLLMQSWGSIQASRVAERLFLDLLTLEKDLLAWETDLSQDAPLYWEEPSTLHNLNSERLNISPALSNRLCFQSVRIGFGLILSWATMLIISSIKRPLLHHVGAAEESSNDYAVAMNIVRSMEYFLHPDMGRIGMNMIGMSLEIAREYFVLRGAEDEKVWFEVIDGRMAEMRSGLGKFLRGLRGTGHRTL